MNLYESAAKEQQSAVDDAYRLLGTRKHGVGCFPTFLLLCLEQRVWESEREDASGKPVAPCSFHDFIHKPYPDGLDSSYEAIEPIIRTEPQLVAEWQSISGRTLDNAPIALLLASIRTDGGTQSRAAIEESVVAEYQENLAKLPPIVVFYDGSTYWLGDGFHRVEAHQRAGKDSIVAEVRQGTRRDAVLFSVGANVAHGLRRTNADKRRAVELLLRDAEWSKKSDRWIAAKCGVHQDTAGSYRRQLSESDSSAPVARTGQDGKTRKLPERQPSPPAPVEAPPPPPAPLASMRQMTLDEPPAAPSHPTQLEPPPRAEQPAPGPPLAQVHRLEGLSFNEARRAVQRLSDTEWAQLVEQESERRAHASQGGAV